MPPSAAARRASASPAALPAPFPAPQPSGRSRSSPRLRCLSPHFPAGATKEAPLLDSGRGAGGLRQRPSASPIRWQQSLCRMDLRTVPASREPGWYLKLMAPNVKGSSYAWLDPSRLYCHPQALQDCVEDLVQRFRDDAIDLVVGIDAMGFILGAAIAATLRKGFVAIRKAGHLCVETRTQTYRDYTDCEKVMETRTDAISPGVRVLLVDQWVETGGTMQGAIQLVERQGGVVAGIAAICIEDSDGGSWLKSRYKWSHCVPPQLMPQFNAHWLDSSTLSHRASPARSSHKGTLDNVF